MGKDSFKKITLFDLAAARVKQTLRNAAVKPGDLIEIIEPFVEGENFVGLVTEVNDDTISVYHSDTRQTINWNRRVKCKVHKV